MKYKKTKIFLGVILIVGLGFFMAATKGLKEGVKVQINNVNLNSIKDGQYKGKYSKDRWISEVEVTVKDNKIKGIELLSNPITPDISQKLFNKVINTQKVNVDVISGATVTSKAYLKSIENALNN